MPGKSSKRFYTYRILEVLDVNEYNALSAANKGLLNVLVSCGKVDITSGSFTRNFLYSIFPDGTNTYDALVNLLDYTEPPGP